MDPLIVVAVLAGLGLSVFVNLVVARLPRERQMGGWPRCTRCGRPLAWWQLLPIAGWLAQGGRGRCCGRSLHWIFLLDDLLLLSASVLLYIRYGLGVEWLYLMFVAVVLVLPARSIGCTARSTPL